MRERERERREMEEREMREREREKRNGGEGNERGEKHLHSHIKPQRNGNQHSRECPSYSWDVKQTPFSHHTHAGRGQLTQLPYTISGKCHRG